MEHGGRQTQTVGTRFVDAGTIVQHRFLPVGGGWNLLGRHKRLLLRAVDPVGGRRVRRIWGIGWTGKLSDNEKYEITSWAFSYFMKSNLTVSEAVSEAVRKAKPERVNEDGSLKVHKADLLELQLRVKNML